MLLDPEMVKVTAYGQLGVLVTEKFIRYGCASIPIRITELAGCCKKDNEVIWQFITTMSGTVIVATFV
jgi:hypothetical protein